MTDTTADNVDKPLSEQLLDRINALEAEVEELSAQVEYYRMHSEEMSSKLMESTINNNKNLDEIRRLRIENNHLRRTPLLVATVIEKQPEGCVILRQHGNNQEIMTRPSQELFDLLENGSRVSVNNSMAIVAVMDKTTDVRARVMEVIERPEVDYNQIGGLEQQVMEVIETIELPLTRPEAFKEMGIQPPRGVLLYGAPGTGKTLLAKAVAHHAKATFIRMSGSELVHKFIGEGAQLVRDMFALAREKAPTIVFIDELDSVAARRTNDGTTGSAEVNRTMMQLLYELDGFSDRGDVRVIAATNRIDILDPAVLRPGRFDRLIEMPLPDENSRKDISEIHTRDMPLAREVTTGWIASRTEGLSGAHIRAICTEAGMFAIRRDGKSINRTDFEQAIDKVRGEQEQLTALGYDMYG